MRIVFSEKAWEEYLYWQRTNKRVVGKINDLLKAISREPFRGQGKPEPLRHELSGLWSRRIDSEHRLVYKVNGDEIGVISCRFHYD